MQRATGDQLSLCGNTKSVGAPMMQSALGASCRGKAGPFSAIQANKNWSAAHQGIL